MGSNWMDLAQGAEKKGRFGLAELLFQRAEASADDAAYRAFDAAQRAGASAILAAIYSECASCMDGSNLVFLLRRTAMLAALLEQNFDSRAGAAVDAVSAALYEELQRTERLVFCLAFQQGWSLLADETAQFPDDEQVHIRALCRCAMGAVRGIAEPPLVSVLIPAYNLPDLFARTMRSAAIQDWPNLEILVADNSTNEETAAEMERYADDPRVRYIRNRTARTKAENFAVFEHEARGEYLQWLMQDDILLPQKITCMARALMDNPQITLVGSQRAFIDARGIRWVEERMQKVRPDFGITDAYASYDGHTIVRAMLTRLQNLIGEPPSVLFRRRDLIHHYWRAESRGYRVISDVVMWMELLEKGNLLMFRDALSCYRRHGKQEGQRSDILIESRLEWCRLLDAYRARENFFEAAEVQSAYRKLMADYESGMKKVSQRIGGPLSAAYEKRMSEIRQILAVLESK